MGLSRRQFTKEFKVPPYGGWARCIHRGVARGVEVNPNVLHRWRREFREAPGNVFPGKWQAALVGRADCRAGTEDRSASTGD